MSVPTMTTHPSLTGLPVEIIELFATLLDLPDLCSLRLASSELAAKASQGRFKTFSREKEIDLDDSEQLETFKRVTGLGGLGCLVENLTLLRYVGGGETSPNRNVLVDCLRNRKMNSACGSLRDLSLDVQTKDDASGRVSPHRSMWDKRTWDTTPISVKASTRSPHRRNWKATWNLAGSLYRETMKALHESQLSVKRLSVFGDTENCSLGFDQLASYPEEALPATSLAGLEELSLSLSHSVEFQVANHEDTGAALQSHFQSLETLLRLCPKLEKLDLHFFKIWNGAEEEMSDMLVQERRFFDYITASSVKFPNLTSLTLRGISCTPISLQHFLESALRLRHVDIMRTNLIDGQWRPIFNTLSTQRKLEYLHLEDLYERGRVYLLGVPGKPKVVMEGQRRGTDELTRSGKDTALVIEYEVANGRLLGSPVKNRYLAVNTWLYGPVPLSPRD